MDEKSEVLITLDHHRNLQHGLCNALEEIADSLPGSTSKQACLIVSRQIYPIVKAAHIIEEQELFPLLQNANRKTRALDASLERLQFEHWEDESFAEELTESLMEFATGDRTDLTDKLSYMIRGFVEGLKRHMAFETEHLLPLVSQAPKSKMQ